MGGLLYDTYQTATYVPGVSQRVNGIDSFFHTDWLGSTRDLSDGTGNNFPSVLRYDAFGNKSAWMGSYDPTVFQFAGDWGYQTQWATGPEDGPGLQYLQQRYYDPAIGRFLSPDPIGFAGGPNMYQYADSDPTHWTDPLGLADQRPPWARSVENSLGGLGSVIGGLGGGGLGGGIGFTGGLVGGPLAIAGAGAGAAEGVALGTAAGYTAGRLAGRVVSDLILYFAANAGGGGPSSGSTGNPCPRGPRRSFKGLIGKQFEEALGNLFNTKPFKVPIPSTGKIVEFDGKISPTDWFEAKSGGEWNRLLADPTGVELNDFRIQIGQQQKAAGEYNVKFRLFSNTPIPDSIKRWLTKRGVPFKEYLQ